MKIIPSPRLERERSANRLVREDGDPIHRRLRIYAIHPNISADQGGLATVQIPYEQLRPGPTGQLFKVVTTDGPAGTTHAGAELESPAAMIDHGYTPSMSDRSFAGQMLYAVAMSLYSVFARALGRDLPLGLRCTFGGEWVGGNGLRLLPFGEKSVQATFFPELGEIRFGYFEAREASRGYSPKSEVYSCLSHDVIVHELTHAFLHAIRPRLILPCNADVLALHEAFADLVAIFQRLRYRDFVIRNIEYSSPEIDSWEWLGALAEDFSSAAGIGKTLRNLDGDMSLSSVGDEPHQRGLVLVQAVYAAFKHILSVRFRKVFLLATGGSGRLSEGQLPPVLVNELAHEVQKTAEHMLGILIRAFDYCPPLAPTFGDYLRALITADKLMVADDDRRYRQAFIDAFRQRGIYPVTADGTSAGLHMTEDGLFQPRTSCDLNFASLSFSAEGFSGDSVSDSSKEANAHGKRVAAEMSKSDALAAEIGVDCGQEIDLLSLRTFRKIGPEGNVVTGTISELAWEQEMDDRLQMSGALVLTDNQGKVTHITGRFANRERAHSETTFQRSHVGQRFWQGEGDRMAPRDGQFRLLCRT